jgi:hypothetical protein
MKLDNTKYPLLSSLIPQEISSGTRDIEDMEIEVQAIEEGFPRLTTLRPS